MNEPGVTAEIVLGVLLRSLPGSYERLREVAEKIVSDSGLITREAHHAALALVDHAHNRDFSRAERAERHVYALQQAINIASLRRAVAVADFVRSDALRMSRTAKHDDDCWRRHASCLASRISNMMADPEYNPDPPEGGQP